MVNLYKKESERLKMFFWKKKNSEKSEPQRANLKKEASSEILNIGLDPNDANVYYNRGNAYDGKGQYDKAIEDYNKAIALNPNYAAGRLEALASSPHSSPDTLDNYHCIL